MEYLTVLLQCLTALLKYLTVLLEYFDLSDAVSDVTQSSPSSPHLPPPLKWLLGVPCTLPKITVLHALQLRVCHITV